MHGLQCLKHEELVFTGFPGIVNGSDDILRQVSTVIELWNLKNTFPVKFEQLFMGSQVKDETNDYIQEMNLNLSQIIKSVFTSI